MKDNEFVFSLTEEAAAGSGGRIIVRDGDAKFHLITDSGSIKASYDDDGNLLSLQLSLGHLRLIGKAHAKKIGG